MDLEPVTLNSLELILSVWESSPSYFLKVEGQTPSHSTVEQALLTTPIEHGDHYSKEFLLIRREGKPIGTVELHLNHPLDECVYIGLLLIREDLTGRGIGRAAYLTVENYLRERHGARCVRLGVSDHNDVSGFWSRLGFRANGRSYEWEGERRVNHVVEYEKILV